jgi:hypothetical protein
MKIQVDCHFAIPIAAETARTLAPTSSLLTLV